MAATLDSRSLTMSADELPVLLDISEGVATVTLNRPRAMNALAESGTPAVSTAAAGRQYFNDLFATCSKMMLSIVNLPQPVIAEVQGIATAAGCQLVATCDLAVAAEDARFATSGVNIGLFCSTPMVALSRNVARKQAMEMLLLGGFVPAEDARAMGLVNRVVPQQELETASRDMALRIAGKAPVAIKIGKRAFYEQAAMSLEDAYAYTGAAMAENMMARDTEAGIRAFMAKEPMPEWQGD